MGMKSKFVAGWVAVFSVNAFLADQSLGNDPIPGLSVDPSIEIASKLPINDLIRLGKVSKSLNVLVKLVVKGRRYQVDLSEIALTQAEFMNSFREGALFHLAQNILLSNQSYQGNWIDLLPTENLKPHNGISRLKVKTTTGAIFDYVGQHPEFHEDLGHGWRAPDGLIWFVPANRVNRMGFDDAILYCNRYQARLPLLTEWNVFSQFLGSAENPENQGHTYKPQVFSNLNAWYWALPRDGIAPSGEWVPVFNGNDGKTFNTNRSHNKAVLCVYAP